MKKVTRVGVYGVVIKDNQILLVSKGPVGCYAGLLDLPGGGIEFGETCEQALQREFEEEVAMTFKSMKLLENLTHCMDALNVSDPFSFHQIGQIYSVQGCCQIQGVSAEGEFGWYPIHTDLLDLLTPFAKITVKNRLEIMKKIDRKGKYDPKILYSNEIDWHSQWALHGHDFHDGYVHILVNDKMIKLTPGPGFGDLSHATTQLVLEMMRGHVENKVVVDIGCGSGILTLAAAAMNAKFVYGIDIDEGAIAHAKANAQINGMENRVDFCLPSELVLKLAEQPPTCEITALMNMIQSEQQVAWASIENIHHRISEIYVSGVLEEEKISYIQSANNRGWILKDENLKDGWLGFHYEKLGYCHNFVKL